MNKLILIFALVLPLSFFSSCKDDNLGESMNATSTMKATIDGVNWNAINNRITAHYDSEFSCSGKATDSSEIYFWIEGPVYENVIYNFGNLSLNTAGFHSTGSPDSWATNGNAGCNGTLKITLINKKLNTVSGIFSFKAFNLTENTFIEVTNGVFNNVPFTTGLNLVTNFMTLYIDRTKWTSNIVKANKNNRIITIDARKSTGTKSFTLTFPDSIQFGIYPIDGTNITACYRPDFSKTAIATSGSLFIISKDETNKSILGGFNFTARDPSFGGRNYSISNGTFNITYQ